MRDDGTSPDGRYGRPLPRTSCPVTKGDAAALPSAGDQGRGGGAAGAGAADGRATGALPDLSQRVLDGAVAARCAGHRWRGRCRHRTPGAGHPGHRGQGGRAHPGRMPGAGGWGPTSSTGRRSSRRRPTSTSSRGRSPRCPAGRTGTMDRSRVTRSHSRTWTLPRPATRDPRWGRTRRPRSSSMPRRWRPPTRPGRGSRTRSATGTATARPAATPQERRAWRSSTPCSRPPSRSRVAWAARCARTAPSCCT